MLFGSFVHSIDEKGRLTIPSKIRAEFSNKLFVIKGSEGTLNIYSEDKFNKYLEKLSKLPMESKNVRDILRTALSSVVELYVDSKSRIQIPTSIIEKYKIAKEVIIVGMLDHIEVWNRPNWDEYQAGNEAKFEDKLEDIIGL